MSEHQRETEFLRQCILYDESGRRRELEQGIAQLQRDERCVRRAIWLLALLTTLGVTGFGYAEVLTDNFPYSTPPSVFNLLCALGVGSLISLLGLLGLEMVYRKKLAGRREECRQIVARLLESRLGSPATMRLPDPRDNSVGDRNAGPVQVATGAEDSSAELESNARG